MFDLSAYSNSVSSEPGTKSKDPNIGFSNTVSTI